MVWAETMRSAKMRGITLLEVVVVIALIAILIGLLLDRVVPLLGQAERVAYLHTKRQLESALLLEAAERVVRGESGSLPALAGGNPMDLLLEPPGNYLGRIEGVSRKPPPRSWSYDPGSGALVYWPGPHARFDPQDGPQDRIELVVDFVFRDRDGNGSFDAAVDRFDGLRLVARNEHRWAVEASPN